MTIQELREARNKTWEGAKAFVESKRDKDGLLSAEDAATYAEMEKKVKDYSLEIERMEQMDAMENELRQPVNVPIVTKPVADKPKDVKVGRASDEYKNGMLTALRTNFRQVSNVLQEGVDADGGYLVPEEYDSRLIDVLEEENIMRKLAHRITTSGEHKINIAATKPAAAWIEEGGVMDIFSTRVTPITALRNEEDIIVLQPTDIFMIRVENGDTIIYGENDNYRSRRRLYELKEQLGNSFMQISKSALINLSYMDSVESSFSGTLLLKLKNGCKENVSRTYLPEFKKYLGL